MNSIFGFNNKGKYGKRSQPLAIDWKQCVLLNVAGKMPIRALSKLDLIRDSQYVLDCDDDLFVNAEDAVASFEEISKYINVSKLRNDSCGNWRRVCLIDNSTLVSSPTAQGPKASSSSLTSTNSKLFSFVPLSVLLGRLLLSLQQCDNQITRGAIREFSLAMLNVSLSSPCITTLNQESTEISSTEQSSPVANDCSPMDAGPTSSAIPEDNIGNKKKKKFLGQPFAVAMNMVEKCSDASFAESLRVMKTIVPPTIFSTSLKEVIEAGLSTAVAQRIWNKRLLWTIWMAKDDIAKMHISDLRGRFHYHGLDLLEMKAVWICLPQWEGASPKAMWKNDFKSKLVTMIVADICKTLSTTDQRNPVYAGVKESELVSQPLVMDNPIPKETIKYVTAPSRQSIEEELRLLALNHSFDDDCSSNDEETPIAPRSNRGLSSGKRGSAPRINLLQSPMPACGLHFQSEIDEMACIGDSNNFGKAWSAASRGSGRRQGDSEIGSVGSGLCDSRKRSRGRAATAVSSLLKDRLSADSRKISFLSPSPFPNQYVDHNSSVGPNTTPRLKLSFVDEIMPEQSNTQPGNRTPFSNSKSKVGFAPSVNPIAPISPMPHEHTSIHGFTTPSSRVRAMLMAAAVADRLETPSAAAGNSEESETAPMSAVVDSVSRPKPTRRLVVKSSTKKPRAPTSERKADVADIVMETQQIAISSPVSPISENNLLANVGWMDDLAASPVPSFTPVPSPNEAQPPSRPATSPQDLEDKENSSPTIFNRSKEIKSLSLKSPASTIKTKESLSTGKKSKKLKKSLAPRPSLAARLQADPALLTAYNTDRELKGIDLLPAPDHLSKQLSLANLPRSSFMLCMPSIGQATNDDDCCSDINFNSPVRGAESPFGSIFMKDCPSLKKQLSAEPNILIGGTPCASKQEIEPSSSRSDRSLDTSNESLQAEIAVDNDWINKDEKEALSPVMAAMRSICSNKQEQGNQDPVWSTFWRQIHDLRQQIQADLSAERTCTGSPKPRRRMISCDQTMECNFESSLTPNTLVQRKQDSRSVADPEELTLQILYTLSIDEIKSRISQGSIVTAKSTCDTLLISVCENSDSIRGPLEMLMLLVDILKADPNCQKQSSLETPLHLVLTKPILARYLISRGANVLLCDKSGECPLQLCLDYGFDWIVPTLEATGREDELLVDSNRSMEYTRLLICFGGYARKVKDLLDSKRIKISPEQALAMLEFLNERGHEAYANMKEPVEAFELLESIVLENIHKY